MRYRMNLQLFDDGGGAGSGNQGGNAGTGNGGQGSAGSASGAHGTGTYTYEQLEEIAGARVERSERTALANFFRNQGMTESEVTQAINNFKAERAANQPNATKLQKDLDDRQNSKPDRAADKQRQSSAGLSYPDRREWNIQMVQCYKSTMYRRLYPGIQVQRSDEF